MKKWTKAYLDYNTHRMLEKIQDAEVDKFSYLSKRNREDVIADVIKLGIPAFIKTHELDIKL